MADELYIDRLANIIAFIDSNITHFETYFLYIRVLVLSYFRKILNVQRHCPWNGFKLYSKVRMCAYLDSRDNILACYMYMYVRSRQNEELKLS